MNTTNPYLYEELWREHQRQMRRQVAINRMVLPHERMALLQWLSNLLLRLGTALQHHREQRLMHAQKRILINEIRTDEYHLSR